MGAKINIPAFARVSARVATVRIADWIVARARPGWAAPRRIGGADRPLSRLLGVGSPSAMERISPDAAVGVYRLWRDVGSARCSPSLQPTCAGQALLYRVAALSFGPGSGEHVARRSPRKPLPVTDMTPFCWPCRSAHALSRRYRPTARQQHRLGAQGRPSQTVRSVWSPDWTDEAVMRAAALHQPTRGSAAHRAVPSARSWATPLKSDLLTWRAFP